MPQVGFFFFFFGGGGGVEKFFVWEYFNKILFHLSLYKFCHDA